MAGLVVGADQGAKALVRRWLPPGESIPILPPVFHLTHVQNTGAAFGLFQGYAGAFIVCSLAIGVWIILQLSSTRRRDGWLIPISLSLVLGGAVGNAIDRLCAGFVTDFLDFRVWPVFNIADSAITVGVALLIWQTLRGEPSEPSRPR